MTQVNTAAETIPVLQLEQLTAVRQDHHGQTTLVLDAISCLIRKAEISVLIGPSGSGKSTLIRLINRLEDPTSGRILLDGQDIAGIDPLVLRQQVCMMLQKAFMFEGSVLENLQVPFRYRKEAVPTADSDAIQRCLALARLSSDYLSRDARSLSGGEQQRVNLARALISRPQVLLLDEPTSALDRPTADRLAQTLHDICRTEQLAILMVTHDLRLAGRIADQLIYLEKGRIIEQGQGAQLLQHPRTEAFRQFLSDPAPEKDDIYNG